jgi:hypothetical protein
MIRVEAEQIVGQSAKSTSAAKTSSWPQVDRLAVPAASCQEHSVIGRSRRRCCRRDSRGPAWRSALGGATLTIQFPAGERPVRRQHARQSTRQVIANQGRFAVGGREMGQYLLANDCCCACTVTANGRLRRKMHKHRQPLAGRRSVRWIESEPAGGDDRQWPSTALRIVSTRQLLMPAAATDPRTGARRAELGGACPPTTRKPWRATSVSRLCRWCCGKELARQLDGA